MLQYLSTLPEKTGIGEGEGGRNHLRHQSVQTDQIIPAHTGFPTPNKLQNHWLAPKPVELICSQTDRKGKKGLFKELPNITTAKQKDNDLEVIFDVQFMFTCRGTTISKTKGKGCRGQGSFILECKKCLKNKVTEFSCKQNSNVSLFSVAYCSHYSSH